MIGKNSLMFFDFLVCCFLITYLHHTHCISVAAGFQI